MIKYKAIIKNKKRKPYNIRPSNKNASNLCLKLANFGGLSPPSGGRPALSGILARSDWGGGQGVDSGSGLNGAKRFPFENIPLRSLPPTLSEKDPCGV